MANTQNPCSIPSCIPFKYGQDTSKKGRNRIRECVCVIAAKAISHAKQDQSPLTKGTYLTGLITVVSLFSIHFV
jgi:hypothetical protein